MRNITLTISQIILGVFLLCGQTFAAETVTITMHEITTEGVGKDIGTITATDTPDGLFIKLQLKGLPPGPHGFHVHENAQCGPKIKNNVMVAGLAAGGHYDPGQTKEHEGPHQQGHLGDLPVLIVDDNGQATHYLIASRLKVSDLKGRSIMIHAHGDNYSDTPKKLGGGGARIACGVLRELEN